MKEHKICIYRSHNSLSESFLMGMTSIEFKREKQGQSGGFEYGFLTSQAGRVPKQPLQEIPADVIKKMFLDMDTDIDF